jgi:hypothetical protein
VVAGADLGPALGADEADGVAAVVADGAEDVAAVVADCAADCGDEPEQAARSPATATSITAKRRMVIGALPRLARRIRRILAGPRRDRYPCCHGTATPRIRAG